MTIQYQHTGIAKQTCIIGFVCLLSLTFCKATFGQNVHPKVQAQIDSMQLWIQHQMATNGKVDKEKLQQWNQRIKNTQTQIKADNQEQQKIRLSTASNNKIINKSGKVGSSWEIPSNTIWTIKKMAVSKGLGGYRVLADLKSLPKTTYKSGEMLHTPSYSASAALLTNDQTNVTYYFTIQVKSLKNKQ